MIVGNWNAFIDLCPAPLEVSKIVTGLVSKRPDSTLVSVMVDWKFYALFEAITRR